jgi:beta-glucosidase
LSLNVNWTVPASPSAADYDAFRQSNGMWVRWYFDPLYGRHYPADMVADAIKRGYLPQEGLTFVKENDLEAIAAPTDFLGLNYYTRFLARSQDMPEEQNLSPTVFQAPRNDADWFDMGWEVYPEGLFRVLSWLYFHYQPPKIYITENGCSYSDSPDKDGRVHDQRRIRYLSSHIDAAQRAIQAGIPLEGYFVWSLLDNFEWGHGYSQRFGLVWVDYQNQKRILKDSALWYKQVIANK